MEEKKLEVEKINRKETEIKRRNEEYKLLPPDDFTKLSIVPTLHELKEKNTFLRAMPEYGG